MKLVMELSLHYQNVVDWCDSVKTIKYQNTLSNLLIDIENSLTSNDNLSVFLNAPRLERLAINLYCNEKTDERRAFEIKVRSFVEQAYLMNYDKALNLLEELKSEQDIINNLTTIIYEPEDQITLTYLNPNYIIDFFNVIKPVVNNNTILVSLSQGATRAGVSISNGFCISHLPIRLSMHKSHDVQPHIRNDEFLREVNDKNIFVFDEDCSSGITLYVFKQFLNKFGLNPHHRVIAINEVNGKNQNPQYGVIATSQKPFFGKPDYFAIEY